MKKTENFAPFDYAQGDCQTERSRSLLSLTKRHWLTIDYFKMKKYFQFRIFNIRLSSEKAISVGSERDTIDDKFQNFEPGTRNFEH